MRGGYMNRFLWVDLDSGELSESVPDEALFRDYVGGYGVAARMLYDLIPAGIDPLGPENVLAFMTGPLTGTAAPTGTRWTVAAKSPLTGGWGDANGSGFFGAGFKRSGFDAVFFKGISPRPVYLYLEGAKAELRDASHLWGMDTYEIEHWVQTELGKGAEAACIGPAGERLSLISGVIHKEGRAAARSGLGAVMGSKRVKMVAVRGTIDVPLAAPDKVAKLRKKYVKEVVDGTGASDFYRLTGTPGYTPVGARNGDSPTRNWGASVLQYPNPEALEFKELDQYRKKRRSCRQCPIGCWGTSELEYEGEPLEAHRPEYETGAGFGTMMLNTSYPGIIKANELCNRYGLDTISAAGVVAFAIECYEHGLITREDTGGIQLAWGDDHTMNAILKKVALREDIGDLLADGVMRAAAKLGPESEPFAVHVGGQEIPMHDPRFEPGLGVIYKIDATPGRHTQGFQYGNHPDFPSERPQFGENPEQQKGRGLWVKEAICMCHTMSCSGICMFGFFATHLPFIPEFMTYVTGESFTVDDMMQAGERIANIRQAFNVREGINAVAQPVPERAYGRPPLPDGPTAGIEVQVEAMLAEYLDQMEWTQDAAVPTRPVLERLGIKDVAAEFWD